MKKSIKAIIAVCLSVMVTATVFPLQQGRSTSSQASVLINYSWYRDEEMTDPTGTQCATNTEILRLMTLYPGYTFSSTFSMGLSPFEFGFHNYYPMVTIYSNR